MLDLYILDIKYIFSAMPYTYYIIARLHNESISTSEY